MHPTNMVYPGNNKLIRWLFGLYIRQSLKRNFHRINFNEITVDRSRATLLLANHYSWWDGFIFYQLNRLIFKKRPYVMVLETTLKRWPFMRHLGAFSITPHSKGMLQSLTYAARLLDDPDNLLLIFPQGKLYSNFMDVIPFETGLSQIVAQSSKNFEYIMAASFIEYFDHSKPSVNVYLKSAVISGEDINTLKNVYNQHYNQSKQLQTQTVI